MSNCELIGKCVFFHKLKIEMPSTSQSFKKVYCEQNFYKCTSYKVTKADGSDVIPENPIANQKDQVAIIVNE